MLVVLNFTVVGQYTCQSQIKVFAVFWVSQWNNARLQQKNKVNFFVFCKLGLTKLVSVFILVRLCNTIVFGMGPTDDTRDGISLDEVVSDEKPLAISHGSVDEK